jgi:hypothetical protein
LTNAIDNLYSANTFFNVCFPPFLPYSQQLTGAIEKTEVKPTVGTKEKSSKGKKGSKDDWTFLNSVIFTFTVITTIGYGNVSPASWHGQLFVMIYGLIGVPLTMLVR